MWQQRVSTDPLVSNNMYNLSSSILNSTPNVRRLDYTHDIPPLGCNADAMKLFVGNIPKSYTAESLRPLFEAIGTVIELVVVRDKLTDESKGSAFVWYQTRSEAERAIAELHLRRVLHDPTGEQDRPLVVRRANPKVPPVLLPTAPFLPQGIHLSDSFDIPSHLKDLYPVTQIPNADIFANKNQINQLSHDIANIGLNSPPSLSNAISGNDLDPLLTRMSKNQNIGCLFEQTNPYLLGNSQLNAQGTSCSGLPITQASHITQNNSSHNNSLLQNLSPGGNNQVSFDQVTLALQIMPSQISVIGINLHNIQGTSGAVIQLTPGAGEMYVVLLSGNEKQVASAKNMVHELIAQVI